jgi:uncharacterized membrane protein YeaQ/YmgE (transglycosylase-associated protein family)
MPIEQIIIWSLVGGCVGFLASLVSWMKLGFWQAFIVGVSGACLSGWLLEAVTLTPQVGIGGTLAIAFTGAAILLAVFTLSRMNRLLFPDFEPRQTWSFVQPFEE